MLITGATTRSVDGHSHASEIAHVEVGDRSSVQMRCTPAHLLPPPRFAQGRKVRYVFFSDKVDPVRAVEEVRKRRYEDLKAVMT